MNTEKRETLKSKLKFITLFIIPILTIIFLSCNDNTVEPVSDHFGITGLIMDTSGHPLDSVQIYCMYNYNYIPIDPYSKIALKKINSSDSVSFNLCQNIPNPFSISTFIRFSLPEFSVVNLTVTDKLKGNVKYSYVDSLQYGLYQIYLDHLVIKQKLTNGIYNYTLTAKSKSGTLYKAEKEMLVISDSGIANSITGHNGQYFISYNNIYSGDSVNSTTDGYYFYKSYLTNSVYLEIRRRGFITKYVQVNIYPDVLLHQDFVLERERL